MGPRKPRLFFEMTMRLIISQAGGSLLRLQARTIPSVHYLAASPPTHEKIAVVVLSSSTATRNNPELFANLSDTLHGPLRRRTGASPLKQIYLTGLRILAYSTRRKDRICLGRIRLRVPVATSLDELIQKTNVSWIRARVASRLVVEFLRIILNVRLVGEVSPVAEYVATRFLNASLPWIRVTAPSKLTITS